MDVATQRAHAAQHRGEALESELRVARHQLEEMRNVVAARDKAAAQFQSNQTEVEEAAARVRDTEVNAQLSVEALRKELAVAQVLARQSRSLQVERDEARAECEAAKRHGAERVQALESRLYAMQTQGAAQRVSRRSLTNPLPARAHAENVTRLIIRCAVTVPHMYMHMCMCMYF